MWQPPTARARTAPNRLSVVPSTKGDLERETGLEPATFSLEGLSVFGLWHVSWKGEYFVSSYRVVFDARADRGAGLGGSAARDGMAD